MIKSFTIAGGCIGLGFGLVLLVTAKGYGPLGSGKMAPSDLVVLAAFTAIGCGGGLLAGAVVRLLGLCVRAVLKKLRVN
jgi:hypothetical protein